MERIRRTHDAQFKAEVALAAARGDKTQLELSDEYQVHTSQIRRWRRHLLRHAPSLFVRQRKRNKHSS